MQQEDPTVSKMAGASEQAGYQSIRPVEVLSDQVDAPLGSMRHAEQQVFGPRPFWECWCQDGPVDNCCGCFPLRKGIMLLSFTNLLDGIMILFVDQVMAQKLEQIRRMYDPVCSRGNNTELCKMLLEKKVQAEFPVLYEPLVYLTGIVLICFSLVGMRAAYTGSSKLAKRFMIIYPFCLVHATITIITGMVKVSSGFTQMVVLTLCVKGFYCAYFLKVKWSFYHRRKVMEDMQLATDALIQGHAINMPVTRVPTVV